MATALSGRGNFNQSSASVCTRACRDSGKRIHLFLQLRATVANIRHLRYGIFAIGPIEQFFFFFLVRQKRLSRLITRAPRDPIAFAVFDTGFWVGEKVAHLCLCARSGG